MDRTGAGWVLGDFLGHDLPIHLDALRAGGAAWLTRAFRATGALGADNGVKAIARLEAFRGGSTGRKAVLSVSYDHPDPQLPTELFVKFSRDLDDEVRDRGRGQMESEVRFGLLSQLPDLPVAVPRCLFADYHRESGSGVLISEQIAFGQGGIEIHHPKARDYEVPELREHYDALVTALARLAGAHRAGRFPADVMAAFERRPPTRRAARRAGPTADDIRDRVARYADFAARCPQLLPAAIRSAELIAELGEQAPRSIDEAEALRAALRSSREGLNAFTHWNANIDNAWFWRDEGGALACGLLDWGNVGEINVVTALSSCLVFTEPELLVAELDHFLTLFATVFETSGGGRLDPAVLRWHFDLQVVSGGLRWPLDAVPRLEAAVPDLADITDRFDPRIVEDEHTRTQLHLLTAYVSLWQGCGARTVIDRAVASS